MQAAPYRRYLYLLAFVAGFSTLGVELSASRLLDPWFGNSLIIWASLIGLILAYLAAGYWLGGRIADRSPRLLTLLRITGLGALGIGCVPAVARPVLSLAGRGLETSSAGLLAGSLLAVLMLFALPVTLLGCVSPFVLRLAIRDVEGSGALAGRVYALSTIGSILGAFLPVLLLIPNIGTRATFATLSGVVLVTVLFGVLRCRRVLEALAIIGALALVLWLGWRPAGPIHPTTGLLYETESAFNYIQVVDVGFERQLRLNEGEGIHSVYRPQGGLADGIWDYFLLAPAFNPAPYGPDRVRRVAIVGLAAGTMAHLFTEAYGPIDIVGAEIDPQIIAVGRTWFDMNMPNLTAVAIDGRRLLAADYPLSASGELQVYDLIAVDAYRPPYIPFHLTTAEFFAAARQRLAPEGVVAVNVGRTADDASLVDAIAATMRRAFPSVYVIDEPVNDSSIGNSLVVATRNATSLADFRANLAVFDQSLLAQVSSRMALRARAADPPAGAPIFTDDRAPVEQVIHALVLGYFLSR